MTTNERSGDSSSQSLHSHILQLNHKFGVIFYAGQDRLPRTFSPLVAAVKGLLTCFAMDQTIIATHQIIRMLIMQGGTVVNHIHVPALEKGEGLFDKEAVKFLTGPGF